MLQMAKEAIEKQSRNKTSYSMGIIAYDNWNVNEYCTVYDHYTIGLESSNSKALFLHCVDEHGIEAEIVIPIEGQCENLIGGESELCDNCEDRENCQVCNPFSPKLGGIVIVKRLVKA